jgi:8-oxo-dGTP diphosphatase
LQIESLDRHRAQVRKEGIEGVNGVVRAAGGVISRHGKSGGIDVLLIYRIRERSDWSFPKGKVKASETHEKCALREVREETSLVCRLGEELPSVSYRDRKGRMKVVRYWAMQVINGEAEPLNEVEAVLWLDIASALKLLTYPRDRELLAAFAALVFQGDVA